MLFVPHILQPYCSKQLQTEEKSMCNSLNKNPTNIKGINNTTMKAPGTHPIYLYIILFLYVTVLGIGLSYHEFWMDESHHWLVARDSASLVDLFHQYKYDGHPMLWVFCLWLIGKVTSNLIFVKLFHGIIAGLIAVILLFKAPFKKRYSILFIFGYYPLFEYGMLSRNYALTVLFLLLFCLSYKRNRSLLLSFFLLGLAANSHLFGLIFSVLLSLKLLYDERRHLTSHLAAMLLLLAMVSVAFITIKAPSDHYFYFDASKSLNVQKLGNVVAMWWKTMVPLPDVWSSHYWNTNFFTSNYKNSSLILILLSWGLPLLVLKRKSGYYGVFYLYAFALIAFILLTGLHTSQRIGGFLLFSLLVLIWLEKITVQEQPYIIPISQHAKSLMLYGFFLLQITSAVIMLVADINRPFSNTKNSYHFLNRHVEAGTPIYGGLYCNYIGINNYGSLTMHIIGQKETLNCCDWRVLNKNKDKDFLEAAIHLLETKGYKKMILLTHQELLDFNRLNYKLQLMKHLDNGLVKNENAYIYQLIKL